MYFASGLEFAGNPAYSENGHMKFLPIASTMHHIDVQCCSASCFTSYHAALKNYDGDVQSGGKTWSGTPLNPNRLHIYLYHKISSGIMKSIQHPCVIQPSIDTLVQYPCVKLM